jgi:hypothetical protein
MKKIDKVFSVSVIGGEPFIVKDIYKVLDKLASYGKKIREIDVITNGTIIPGEMVLNSLKKAGAIVMLSNYGELSRRNEELIRVFQDNKIKYKKYRNQKWYKAHFIIDGENRSDEETERVFQDCNAKCLSVMDGKFSRCAFLCHGEALRAFPYSPKNGVDLLKDDITLEDIYNIVNPGNAFPGCRWCSGDPSIKEYIPVAVQTDAKRWIMLWRREASLRSRWGRGSREPNAGEKDYRECLRKYR